MSQLIRLDRTGHTVLAEWAPGDAEATAAAREALDGALARGYLAVSTGEGREATAVRDLPRDAELVILRRPIAGG